MTALYVFVISSAQETAVFRRQRNARSDLKLTNILHLIFLSCINTDMEKAQSLHV